jgi:hypothetical protein
VDKSFVRQTNAQGYSFAAGSNVTGFPAVWQEVSLATVAAAASNQNEFLGTYPGGGPPPPSGFSAWIAGFYPGETDPLIVGQNADPDKDGRSNLVEAYTGGLPNVAEGSPVSGMSKSGNTFVFYIQKAKTPVAGLTGSYEWSTGLGTWNASGASEGGVTVTIAESEFPWDDTAPGYDLYEVTATAAPGAPDELFIRLVVED